MKFHALSRAVVQLHTIPAALASGLLDESMSRHARRTRVGEDLIMVGKKRYTGPRGKIRNRTTPRPHVQEGKQITGAGKSPQRSARLVDNNANQKKGKLCGSVQYDPFFGGGEVKDCEAGKKRALNEGHRAQEASNRKGGFGKKGVVPEKGS